MNEYEAIIIGGGPAGLTAAIYTGRGRMKTAVLERALPGGRAVEQTHIENYPGFPTGISGPELSEKMKEQAEHFGSEFIYDNIIKIVKEDNKFTITGSDNKVYNANSLIIATGASPRKLGIAGEENFTGRGVSYCATCDGPFFKDKSIVVVGGGNTALEEALFLTKFSRDVKIIHRRDRFRGSKIVQERILANRSITPVWNSVISEIKGSKFVESVMVKDILNNTVREIPCEGVFVFVGSTANTGIISNINNEQRTTNNEQRIILELDENGYIKTDEDMRTSVEGIFACGDVRSKKLKQIVTACGEGAIAAFSAEKYISYKKGTAYE